MRSLEAAALAGFDGPEPLQALTVAWALAWNGHEPGPAYLARLQAAASSGSLPVAAGGQRAGLSPAHRAVLLWCAAMHGAATPDVWQAGLRSLAAAAPSPAALGECGMLYLLHASLLVAADAASPARRAGAVGTSARVAPASPAAASAAAPACQPRATREEVLAAAAPLGRKLAARLAEAYAEYVPMHPAIEGPYLALLFVMEQLAAAGEAGGGGGGRGAGAAAGWRELPPGAATAAAATLASQKELARLKRDLLYHWRGDTLLDAVQRVRNQVVYLLTRRMSLTVAQPEDVDVAVPSRWLAVYVRPGPASSSSSSSSSGGGGPGIDGGGPPNAGGGAGEGPDGQLGQLEAAGYEALDALLRDRFAPHVRLPPAPGSAATGAVSDQGQQRRQTGGSSGAAGGPPGMWAARARQLRRLGWRVAVVDTGAWGAMASDAEREAYLLRLLRGAV